jgi:hypothetical protein
MFNEFTIGFRRDGEVFVDDGERGGLSPASRGVVTSRDSGSIPSHPSRHHC